MKVRRMTIDLALGDEHPPAVGDIVYTARTVSRVTSSRPVDSRIWGNRWLMTLQRLDGGVEPQLGARAFHTQPYRRGERPEDVFGPQ